MLKFSMSKFIIEGGYKLAGEIKVAGAKNAVLKLLAASVMSEGEVILSNVPDIFDVQIMIEILKDLGAEIEFDKEKRKCQINSKNISKTELNPALTSKLRASIMLLAPLLSRFGEVKFSYPGGCIIGKRPIDIYLDGFRALGAKVEQRDNFYFLRASKLKGAYFVFPWISHSATESMIMAACFAQGETTLVNAACEPEVVALAEWLNQCGAKISGTGTPIIKIKGVKKLFARHCQIIPDRIECGTFAILAVLQGEEVRITHCQPKDLAVFWKMMARAGANLDIGENYVYIKAKRQNTLRACEIRTHEHPGFATDLQPPFTVLLTQAKGLSLVHETIYEGRLFYTDLLNRMGANIIMCDPHRIVIQGPTPLHGAKMETPDIRAGISLVIAALIARGTSQIENISLIDRGYENIEERLKNLGAKIKRVK